MPSATESKVCVVRPVCATVLLAMTLLSLGRGGMLSGGVQSVGRIAMPSSALRRTWLCRIRFWLEPGPSTRMPMSCTWRPSCMGPTPVPQMVGRVAPGARLTTSLSRTVFFITVLKSESPTTEMPEKGPLWKARLSLMRLKLESDAVMPSPMSHDPLAASRPVTTL